MFEKNMKLAYLLDFYIEALDEHSANIMRAYYEDDLSLAEIASGENISRQGIRHIIKRCEEQILFLEDRLGLAKRYSELTRTAKELEEVRASIIDKTASESEIKKLERAISTILNKGV